MAEKLPSHFVELVQDALLKSYWRRKAFRNVLRRNGVAEAFLDGWTEDESKRQLWDRLIPALERAERGHVVIKQLAVHLGDQSSFPDLMGWPDEKEKLASAKAAVAALKIYIERERSKVEVEAARVAIREEAARQRAEKVYALSLGHTVVSSGLLLEETWVQGSRGVAAAACQAAAQ